jgi:hypothetical protein
MALDSSYVEQVFVEVYGHALDPNGRPEKLQEVLKREDVTYATPAKRQEIARLLATGINRKYHGVRIAKYTIQVWETF